VAEKDIQKELVTENPPIEVKLDPVVVEKVKPKSFWIKIKNWLGF